MRNVRSCCSVLVMTLLLLSGLPGDTTAQPTRVMRHRLVIPVLAMSGPIVLPTTWLARFNVYRSVAGVPPVTENPTWMDGDALHVNYMQLNPSVALVHGENMTRPGATPQGNIAAQQGNLLAGSPSDNEAQAIDAWMESPMHRFGMLRPELNTTGFTLSCSNTSCDATLDVLGGLGSPSTIHNVAYPGVNEGGVTTRVFSWQFNPNDPTIVPVSASLHDTHGASIPLAPVAGVPTSYFNMYAVTPTVPLTSGITYALGMQVKQNGQLLQKTWSFTVQ